ILDKLRLQTTLSAVLVLVILLQVSQGRVQLASQSRFLLYFLGLATVTFPLATNWFYAYQFAYGLALTMIGYLAITHFLRSEHDLKIFLRWLVGIHVYLAAKG